MSSKFIKCLWSIKTFMYLIFCICFQHKYKSWYAILAWQNKWHFNAGKYVNNKTDRGTFNLQMKNPSARFSSYPRVQAASHGKINLLRNRPLRSHLIHFFDGWTLFSLFVATQKRTLVVVSLHFYEIINLSETTASEAERKTFAFLREARGWKRVFFRRVECVECVIKCMLYWNYLGPKKANLKFLSVHSSSLSAAITLLKHQRI